MTQVRPRYRHFKIGWSAATINRLLTETHGLPGHVRATLQQVHAVLTYDWSDDA
uniref:hypothetical protein n=1 Tax=Ornithinimicrobium sufpigmenti TaxID=2508882 RepID=UPI0037C6D704